jgi:hypothetical protein
VPGLLLAVAASAVGAWHVTCALGLRRSIDVATACVLVFCAQLMGLALAIGGAARALRPFPLLAGALLLGAAEVWLTRRGDANVVRVRSAALVRGAVADALRRAWRHPAALALALLVALQYAWRAALGAFLPASDWDGLVYHLTGPAVWIQQGHVGHTPQQIWADVYPQGQELLIAWIGVFTGSLRLAWMSGLPFLLSGAFAVAGLARSAGARRAHAALAGLGFLAIPAVFVQASTTYVDVATAAAILAGFQLVLALPQAVRPGEPVAPAVRPYLYATGLALAVGTSIKSSNLLAAALVFAVALVQLRRLARDGALLRRAALSLLAPSALLSSYWYLRTWLRHGNPFYPLRMLGFEGPLSFDQIVRDNMTPAIANAHGLLGQLWTSWSADAVRHAFRYDQRMGGFGPQWLYLLLPALLLALVLFAWRRRLDLLGGLALPLGVLLVASPAPWWARYTLFLAGLGCVAFGALLSCAPRPLAALASAAFVAASALGMHWATWPTHLVALTPAGAELLTPRRALDFMGDPALERRLDPLWRYGVLRRVPDGAVLGVTYDGPQHVYLLLGERRERQVVSLGWSEDVGDLRRAAGESGAQFLVLASEGRNAELHRLALTDPAHFRRIGARNGARGFDLFEVIVGVD